LLVSIWACEISGSTSDNLILVPDSSSIPKTVTAEL
jgi:hypothetical protein